MRAIALIAACTTLVSEPACLRRRCQRAASEPCGTTPTPRGRCKQARADARRRRAEKQARKACKIKICDILATKDPQGDDVSCDIVKTWREADITKMLGGRIDWPWGKAVCQSKLDIKREQLVKAMTRRRITRWLCPTQKVSCTLAQKAEGEPYAVEVSIAPKVTFENGKAVERDAQLGRGRKRRCWPTP